MAWRAVYNGFWLFNGKDKRNLPNGHAVYKLIGPVTYIKINKRVYKSSGSKQPWKLVTDKIELIALGENNS